MLLQLVRSGSSALWSGLSCRALSSCSVTQTARVTLSSLQDRAGSRKNRKRVGRGQGSGRGRRCGRGSNGQNSRSGASRKTTPGFEGGQTPLHKRLPKRGFKSHRPRCTPLNLDTLQSWVEQGRLPQGETITTKMLWDAGAVGTLKHGVKLLGRGAEEFHLENMKLQVTEVSAMARAAIEARGGSIDLIYFNRLGLRAHLKPHKFEILPKLAKPPRKWALRHGFPDPLLPSPAEQDK